MVMTMEESTVDEIVQLADQLGMNQEEEWEVNEEQVAEFGEKSLVGRIVSKQSVSVGLFRTMFSRMWKSIGEWKVKSLNEDKEYQYFGLSFNSRAEAKRTLEKQSCFFNGGMLVFEEWPTSGQWRDARLDTVSCWVRMRGLPLKALTLNNIKRLGNMAGKVEDIVWNNPQQIFLNGYVRVKIGFSIQREGHDQLNCTKEVVMEMNLQGTPVQKYGQWLKEEDPIPNCFMAHDQLMARQGGGKVNGNGGPGILEVISRPEIDQSEFRGSRQAAGSGKEQFSRSMQVEKRADDGVDRGNVVNGAIGSNKLKGKLDNFSEMDQNGIFLKHAQSPKWKQGEGDSKLGEGSGDNDFEDEDGREGRKRKCGPSGGVSGRDEGGDVGGSLRENGNDVAVEMGDTEGFEKGKSMGGTGEVVMFTAGDDGAIGRDRDVIMERLDRGLCNEEWLRQFEGADVKLLDWWESDHQALVIDIPVRMDGDKCGKSKRKSRFHFEETWCHEEECTEIIDKMWKERQGRGRPMSFRCKVNKCGKALQDWNKKKKARSCHPFVSHWNDKDKPSKEGPRLRPGNRTKDPRLRPKRLPSPSMLHRRLLRPKCPWSLSPSFYMAPSSPSSPSLPISDLCRWMGSDVFYHNLRFLSPFIIDDDGGCSRLAIVDV
ncbi:hypothetical protein F8388_020109 [Cannabis sativa]|uniref:DUF4283 domain-containing protein n=1 Tax=Cannabis sativa TaxID=3483 RepID=A0A7J6F7P9_CANSA|nr:hypothetical protein F8388_020109 [Cannabis sativa]KAF4402239.1 hypothetical protein G4B88_017751 [Cannabis sativa]